MEKRKIKIEGILLYTLLFVLVCLIIFIPFWTKGLSTVWEIDGVGQYYPAFLYIGQYLRDLFSTGKFASFDLRIAMGEDVFSALNYYGLGDPLNLISIFSNKSNGVFLFSCMFFIRLYLSGISFYLYCRYMKLNEKLIVPGAFVYMCSGYMFCACMMYIQFLSPLIYFPLLLLACEKYFKERKWWWLITVSAYAALCTMYLFYYAALFLVPYAVVRTWFIYNWKNPEKTEQKLFYKRIAFMFKECIVCGALSVIGMIITYPVLYPSLKGMLISERAGGDIIGILTSLTNYRPRRYNTIQLFKGFLPTYDEGVFFFHEIPIVSYLAIVLLLYLFFYLKKRSDRNVQLLIAVIGGCVAYTIPITNIMFSGFVQGFSYDRWIFMLEFVFSIVFICSFSDFIEEKCSKKEMAYNIVSLLAIAGTIIIGFSLYAFAGTEFTDAFIMKKDVVKYVDSPVNYSDTVKNDTGLFRISNDSLTNINGRPENVQMINGYNGLTFWLSIVNPNMQKIADSLEELNSHGFVDQRMFGLENSKVKESLAGVKYYFRKDNNEFPKDYILREKLDFYGEDWEIYENPDALPLCYGFEKEYYSDKLTDEYYKDDVSVIEAAVAADSVVFDNDSVECTIELNEDSVVILAIPYSDGWSATIDDTPATVYNSDIYYMAVNVEKGQHHLKYRYSAYK